MKRIVGWILGGAVATGYVVGCGGGGGGSTPVSRGPIPPAPPPVCTTAVRALAAGQGTQVGGGMHGVLVPPTSIPRPGDAGIRAHTNHLILVNGATTRSPGPTGLSPNQLYKAYGVPLNSGGGAIAIVDAFNYPTALNDFNHFSSTFNLPTEASTNVLSGSNAVFQIVYAGGTVPADDASWSQEMAVDTEWAHAMAPNAKIYLVEAASDNLSDLMAAVGVAKRLPGVKQVTISFGSNEDACSFVHYDSVFLQNGVTFFASAGDTSGQRDFPAESMNVIAVGGTTLTVAGDGSRIAERAWDSTGGGPSQFEPRPIFQDVIETTVQGFRGNADIAAVADPQTGVSVYDSFPFQGSSGWQVFGGTSTATPIIAGMANSSGASRNSSQAQNAAFYAAIGTSKFNDITVGTSGIFSAGPGWDYPTGVGTPNGLGGF